MEYCGLDMGKKSSHFCIVDSSRKILREGVVKNRQTELIRVFGKLPLMRICIEASTKSFWMADRLNELGHEAVVCDPGKTKAIGSGLVKNDKLDARVLATLCQADIMARVNHPDAKTRHSRMTVVARDGLVRSRTRLMTVVRSLLDSEGYELRHATANGFPKAVKENMDSLPATIKLALTPLLQAIEALSAQVAECDKVIAETMKTDSVAQVLNTAPGVGAIVASSYMYAIRDPGRFNSGRAVGAYLGMTTSIYESGTIHRKGGITKHGNRQARWALTMAANAILRKSKHHSALREWGLKIARKRGRKKAVVAVARKLAGILWAMWRDMKPFRYNSPTIQAVA